MRQYWLCGLSVAAAFGVQLSSAAATDLWQIGFSSPHGSGQFLINPANFVIPVSVGSPSSFSIVGTGISVDGGGLLGQVQFGNGSASAGSCTPAECNVTFSSTPNVVPGFGTYIPLLQLNFERIWVDWSTPSQQQIQMFFSTNPNTPSFNWNDVATATRQVISVQPGWLATPANSNWNNATNWTVGSVPTATDIAQFGASSTTTIDISQATQVGGLRFLNGATTFTFNISGGAGGPASFLIGGTGVDNQSGNHPAFVVSGASGNLGTLQFANSAGAGDAIVTTNAFGRTLFTDSSTGGTAQLVTNAGGTVDISGLTSSGLSVGSIAGAGHYILGAKNLTTGSLNTDTEVSGTISGNGGSLTKVGNGVLTLSGANSYSGGTQLDGGALVIGDDHALGTGDVTMAAGTRVLFAAGDHTISNSFRLSGDPTFTVASGTTTIVSGVISDAPGPPVVPGDVVVNGGGILVLSGHNTYSDGTTICGALGGAACGTSASPSTLQLGVDTVFNTPGQPGSGIASSAIGTGTLTFDGGKLQAQAGISERAIGNAVQITANGGTIDSGSGFFRFTGSIRDAAGSSGGTLIIESTGVGIERQVIFAGNNSYSGTTYIDSGTVIANSTAALSANSAFQVNAGATLTLSGFNNIIASLANGAAGGGVVQNAGVSGLATLTITGAKGGTNTFSGVLRDGVGGEGGAAGPKLAIVKNGSSTQVLSGFNQYTGTTTVNGGVLEVDGSIASSSMTTVNAIAQLTGIGTVGNTAIAANGTFAPGSSAPGSSMTINGSLALQSGAQYLVFLNSTTSSFSQVTGTATLGGSTVNALYANGSYVSKHYTILSAAGGVNGTFGPLVNTNLPSNFTASLSYDANTAYLDLALNFTPPVAPNFGSGLSVNQQNVANTLVNYFNRSGGIPIAFGGLTPAGLTQASGEGATGAQQATFDAMKLFMGLLTDPFVSGRTDAAGTGGSPGYTEESLSYAAKGHVASERDAYAAIYTKVPPIVQTFAQRWSIWAAGYGGSQNTSGDPRALGSNDSRSSVYGTAVGADYRFSPDIVAGFAMAGGGTGFNVSVLGTGHSDLFQAGAFVRHSAGPTYLVGAIAYGWQDMTTDRTVTAAGMDRLRAEFNANAWSGRLEAGYRLVAPVATGVGITPYAAGQFTTFDLPAYAESVVSGRSGFALNYAAKSVTDTRSEVGLRTDKSFAVQDAIFTLRGRAA
ncbi:autotransporter domain-containing protein [Bradyrhizobium elkanii]|uniref:autotransporter domain-containing protein n=1 Tax=Bradyrhizobium elkanii TaxID=29448 RepID=UPI0020A07B0E|nr:autotransporter domain-containing protein [Bradyrhizobium elkanii]MCP1970660.1 autotransporter-associated beta strand protein [Bradyrhizobium elkanii]MCS4107833.1 autotransporter-associated beta strand protein [Bradyrhizobium elkanii]